MSVIIILLLASISVAALFLGAFIWSVKNGQYDDEFSPPQRILFEEPASAKTTGGKESKAETINQQ
jgi:cbb3-type cytochrome oxidase maturation protein